MKEVHLADLNLTKYRRFISPRQNKEIQSLATTLKGKRIYFVNSTSFGGGVAELFSSLVPLIRSLDIDIHWLVLEGDPNFFQFTKKVHNLLQGGRGDITKEEINYYLDINKRNSEELNNLPPADIIVIHDPQPMSLPLFLSYKPKLIWRCHIDTSRPNKQVKKLVLSYLPLYNKAIFSLDSFAQGLKVVENKIIIYPSIDPLSPKNQKIKLSLARNIIKSFGINIKQPFLLQVSRFDKWKDPLGVIRVYRSLKKEFPLLQLVLVGSLADDDPEGVDLYKKIKDISRKDKDIFVLTNKDGVGNLEVNAFQRLAIVVLQKSIKEGFGLTVSEALWKKKAVVAGKVGGITVQINDGVHGYLIQKNEECIQNVRKLLLSKQLRDRLGNEGVKKVQHSFLLPRHLLDYLRLFADVLVN